MFVLISGTFGYVSRKQKHNKNIKTLNVVERKKNTN